MTNHSEIVGWFIGLVVGTIVFIVAGVPILFAVSFSVMQVASLAAATLLPLGALIAIVGACLWVAIYVKRAVTRER